MRLRLIRGPSTTKSTLGELYIDGTFECYTLEDVVRKVKIPGETAIPAGTYEMIVTMSHRFKQLMPLLVAVPQFEGIRIHPGNTDKDTRGCILVGQTQSKDFVGRSRPAYQVLLAKLQAALKHGERITIEVG